MVSQEIRQARRDAGQCIRCGGEPIPGQRLCVRHREQQKAAIRRMEERRKSAEVCLYCGGPRDDRYARCSSCRRRLKDKYQTASNRRTRAALVDQTMDAYGGKCVCCGESNRGFLSLDHVNRDGAHHRRQTRQASHIYRWARDNGYPDTLRLMCFNCNMGRERAPDKVCPHQAA